MGEAEVTEFSVFRPGRLISTTGARAHKGWLQVEHFLQSNYRKLNVWSSINGHSVKMGLR